MTGLLVLNIWYLLIEHVPDLVKTKHFQIILMTRYVYMFGICYVLPVSSRYKLGVNSLRTCRIQPCNSSYRLSGHPFEKVSSWTTYMSPKTAPKYMNELRMRYHGLFHQKCNKFRHSFSNPWHVHRKNLDIQQERERKIGYWTFYSSGKPWPIHANEIRKSFLQVGYMYDNKSFGILVLPCYQVRQLRRMFLPVQYLTVSSQPKVGRFRIFCICWSIWILFFSYEL